MEAIIAELEQLKIQIAKNTVKNEELVQLRAENEELKIKNEQSHNAYNIMQEYFNNIDNVNFSKVTFKNLIFAFNKINIDTNIRIYGGGNYRTISHDLDIQRKIYIENNYYKYKNFTTTSADDMIKVVLRSIEIENIDTNCNKSFNNELLNLNSNLKISDIQSHYIVRGKLKKYVLSNDCDLYNLKVYDHEINPLNCTLSTSIEELIKKINEIEIKDN